MNAGSRPRPREAARRPRPVERLLAAREALANRSGKIDWARLNHILIPLPVARRQRPRRELSAFARLFLGVYFLFTPEGRAFFVVVLLAGVFGVDVFRTEIYMLSNVLFAVLAAAVLSAIIQRRAKVDVTLRLPPRVCAGEAFDMELAFARAERKAAPAPHETIRDIGALRVGRPFLPYFARWSGPLPYITEWDEQHHARSHVRATFDRRGDFTLDGFVAYEIAALGLTQKRVGESQGLTIRVVPRPAKVARLRTPLASKHQPGGVALASQTGESMELIGVRDYRRGDRLRDISARTWARTGKPAVREYREEYFTRVGVFLDTEEGLYDDEAFEAAIELCAGIVEHLSGGEALIDLLVAGDRVESLLLGRSLGYVEQALDFLATVEKSPPFDRVGLLERVAPHIEQLSCAIFVAGHFGEEQDAFAREIEARGVRVVRIAVNEEDADGANASAVAKAKSTEKTSKSSAATTLSPRAIRAGESLIL